ncbi:hypothetical protein JTB14_003056 [Gonioctena quinquepunctata]|nr:hypothetical protein JTB14_003056 [Gonioctena quinquepunctata]
MEYGIPKSTIELKKKHPGHKSTFGSSPVVTPERKDTLVRWIFDMAKKGVPCKRDDILQSVQTFLLAVPFKHNRPGDGFFETHPQISQRTSKGVTSTSSCVSEADIRKWFAEIQEYPIEKDLLDVISDPSRVFNRDESEFHICPSTGKVFAKRGSKIVYSVDTAPSKECITVMFTFSADGAICCPMVVYPYQRILDKISSGLDPNWGIGRRKMD